MARPPSGPTHDVRRERAVRPVEGRSKTCAILSTRLDGSGRRGVVSARSGDPMTEILTESFCERCGTRYTFESARPRARMKGVKVLSRGLKNFVMSDETSMDEAMAAARSETDRELTSHQLDAFHKTFNFCMSCRQYTCPNCWNEAEARCLSCAPHLGHEVLPAPFPDLAPGGLMVADGGVNGSNGANGAAHPVELVGVSEIEAARNEEEVDFAARLAALTAPAAMWPGVEADVQPEAIAPETVAEPDATAVVGPDATAVVEPDVAAAAEVAAAMEVADVAADSIEPLVVDEEPPTTPSWLKALAAATVADAAVQDEPQPAPSIEDKAASQTSSMLQRFRAGQDLDAELEAYERERDATAAATDAPVDGPAVEPEVAAEPQRPAEPERPGETASTPPAPVVDDIVAQPLWQMVAPDPGVVTPAGQGVEPPSLPAVATAAPNAEPQWPARPEWTGAAATGLPFLGRPAAPQGGLEALWAESNREVVAIPTKPGRTAGVVQPCVSCGLSLSATARFCRRCGTPQGS